MTVLVSCYWCERVYEEAELLKRGGLDACPYCPSTEIEEVACCAKCEMRVAAEGSDNCDECDEIVVSGGTMKVIDDLAQPRFLRDTQIRNVEQLAKWHARYIMQTDYADMRGDMSGPKVDAKFAEKRRLAKHHLNSIQDRKERRKALAPVVSIFHRPQAG